MAISQKAWGQTKALLCIAMLAGAEVRHVQQDAHFNSVGGTRASSHDCNLQSISPDLNFQEQATCVVEQVEVKLRDPKFQTQVKRFAAKMEGMMANPSFQHQMETMMTDPNVQVQAQQVAEFMMAGLAHPPPLKHQAANLTNRASQVPRLPSAALDQATLAKPGHLAINSPASLKPPPALRTRPSPGGFSLHSAGTHGVALAKVAPTAPRLPLFTRAMNKYYRPSSRVHATEKSDEGDTGEFKLAAWFDPNTRGGILVWGTFLFLVPYAAYQAFVAFGVDKTKVGEYVGAIFVLVSNLLWASTYVFRVASKDMTYTKQLREYEDQVIQKRAEELDQADLDSIIGDIDKEVGETTKTKVFSLDDLDSKDSIRRNEAGESVADQVAASMKKAKTPE